jgi:NAD(P)-dependent dehydrogenase (short-subunit alcohol dehydrogenase family)|tara:strand:+ start:1212 stop:1922 length:711 start_codon:yes stop_codon:yes gene_type:complete
MPTVMVTGANRGIGYEHVAQYAQKKWNVIACARQPEKAIELLQLQDKYGANFIIEELEVTNHKQVDDLSQKHSNTTIDILINNAGTGGPEGMPGAMDYQKIDNMDYQIWRDILEVNLLAPFKVATSFHKQISISDKKTLIMMSSDLGSVSQNTFGGLYSYRASKSALNIVAKGMSNEWKDIIVVALAPGWCRTYLGGAEAEIDPMDSVEDQQKMFESLTETDSGKFLDRFGNEVPW